MATMPRGADLIENSVSFAPGFSIGNVHVMAGVPRIMRAMFDALEPRLGSYRPVCSTALHAEGLHEGTLAAGLERIQARFPQLDVAPTRSSARTDAAGWRWSPRAPTTGRWPAPTMPSRA